MGTLLEVRAMDGEGRWRMNLYDPTGILQALRFARAWRPVDDVCSLPCVRLDALNPWGKALWTLAFRGLMRT
jgi:hypothetical protein